MSLWTPSGEHPVRDERRTPAGGRPLPGDPSAPGAPGGPPGGAPWGAPGGSPEEEREGGTDVDALRTQLAEAPADVVVANHCYGLFELAAVYLSHAPPRLEHARVAIDALGAVVDGLGERLGEAFPPLRDALAQIRLAYVQIAAAEVPVGNGAAANGHEEGSVTPPAG